MFLPQSDKHCKMPTLPERALMKLYYLNSENAAAAVREFFRSLRKRRRGPMSERALKDMMVKFEKTGQLGVLPGRGRKRINTYVIEDIATTVVEASSESLHATVSVPTISRTLDMPYSTVRHIMLKILNFYPYKIQVVQYLKPHGPDTRKTFALEFLGRMAVDDSLPLNILSIGRIFLLS
ncbi:uncharacterized protein TNCV_2907511 [Trichonephila clavipes]|nr:uncharacterized protein TNCV_2907511 [Trichonephila clavipes]